MDTRPGYIKLPREFLDMPLSTKPQKFALFVHLLLLANREAKDWNGVRIERGQIVTSLRSLSKSCGITISGIRTALKGLRQDGLAHDLTHGPARRQGGQSAHDPAHGYTIISICNYDRYEGSVSGTRTRFRTRETISPAQDSAHALATTREDNKYILSLLGDPRFLNIVEEWLEYKRERGQAYKGRKGLSQFCNRLREYSGGDPCLAERIVSDAMAANYSTIYPPKPSKTPKAQHSTLSRTDVPNFSETNYKQTIL